MGSEGNKCRPAIASFMHGRSYPWRFNVWGLFLVIFGVWWFLGETERVPFEWSWVGPLAIVAVGVSMMLGRGVCGCGWGEPRGPPPANRP